MTAHYHFIGIGGAGMSVVAQLFQAHGWALTGSDKNPSANLERLQQAGIECWVGSDPQRIAPGATIVRSTAIRESDPELAWARQQGYPVLHRSQALALASQKLRFIAVAGAHGKTTTSGMLAQALSAAGQDPSFAVGSIVNGFQTGAHLGKGKVFVAEADESDASFLNYRPEIAIITNIEPDHLDKYGTREAFEDIFWEFTQRIKPGGTLILDTDDPGCRRLLDRCRQTSELPLKLWGYGWQERPEGLDSYCQISPGEATATSQSAGYELDSLPAQLVYLHLPGAHNIANACAAYLAGLACGVEASLMIKSLTAFEGTARRFEIRGEVGQIKVIDDYAHHPTEVAAVIAQARQAAPDGHVLVLFQPHLFSRTKAFATRFAQALDQADYAIVCDIFAAREDPDPSVTAELITQQMASGSYLPDKAQAAAQIANLAQAGDLILTVGAGDITNCGSLILQRLAYRFQPQNRRPKGQ